MKKIDSSKIKDFCEKNKSMLILGGVLAIMLILSLYLFLFSGNNEEFSDSIEKQNVETTNVLQNNNAMDNPFVTNTQGDEQNISIPKAPPPLPSQENNQSSVISSNDSDMAIVLEDEYPKKNDSVSISKKIEIQNAKEETQNQKPNDMVSFLKKIQNKIKLKNESFEYEFKEYEVGNKFLDFYEIEDIGENYIRFKDEDYGYNLRFTGEDNE